MSEKKPLVTFALFAFNQEKYIREAVDGAFSQTYSPLEIILSDDCSSDRTFEIMQEMVNEYEGPHALVLNKNKQNLGIGAHVNTLLALSRGELIVFAAGDDISLPERTTTLVSEWLEDSRSAQLVYSELQPIDEAGRDMGAISNEGGRLSDASLEQILSANLCTSGAACAIDSRLYSTFGPLLKGVWHEDRAWASRAKLSGRIEYINKPLVRYRAVGGISRGVFRKSDWYSNKAVPWYERFIADYDQKIADLERFGADTVYIQLCLQQKAKLSFKLAAAKGTMSLGTFFKDQHTSKFFRLMTVIKCTLLKLQGRFFG